MTIRTTTPFINWLILKVAPLDILTAVLTKTPVQGVDPSKPHTRFETASPLTSSDWSNLVPVRLSAILADIKVSKIPTNETFNAPTIILEIGI